MSIKARGKKKIFWCDFSTPARERIRRSLHTTDRKEAKKLEAELISDFSKSAKEGYKDAITLGQAYRHAFRVRDEWRSASFPESIHGVYGHVVNHFTEERPLASINSDTLVEYGEGLIKAGLSPSTVNKRISLINVLFEEAIRFGKFQGAAPKVDRYKVKNCRRRVITAGEEAEVLSILRSKGTELTGVMADLIVILADTGACLSEALGLAPNRIDVEARAVLLGDVKSGDDRIVPLTERALEVLVRRNSTPMFTPLTVNSCGHIWAKVRNQMGLSHDKEFVLHSFRRTFASNIANAGIDSFRLQKVMGHKSLLTTQRSVQVSTEAVRGLVQIIEERNSKIPSSL